MVPAKLNELKTASDQSQDSTFTLAHLSDPHMACTVGVRLRELLNKRLYGYVRWKLLRAAEHQEKVLSALQDDLRRTIPDHIAVTGDLTHLSLPAEFQKARQWLHSLGSPARVTVVPGNHDAYVSTNWDQSLGRWTNYMRSDNHQLPPGAPPGATDNVGNIFPSLRIRGHIALIGVCTAQSNTPYLAVGSIGSIQLQKLETILARTARQRLFRVLLIHHPPAPGTVSWRKRLTDAAPLRSILAGHGAELILHGHTHRTAQSYLKTPAGNVPVMGAPSASALGRTPQRRARYYIYRITPGASDWEARLSVRVYSTDEKRFIAESEQHFNTPFAVV